MKTTHQRITPELLSKVQAIGTMSDTFESVIARLVSEHYELIGMRGVQAPVVQAPERKPTQLETKMATLKPSQLAWLKDICKEEGIGIKNVNYVMHFPAPKKYLKLDIIEPSIDKDNDSEP